MVGFWHHCSAKESCNEWLAATRVRPNVHNDPIQRKQGKHIASNAASLCLEVVSSIISVSAKQWPHNFTPWPTQFVDLHVISTQIHNVSGIGFVGKYTLTGMNNLTLCEGQIA